MKKEIIQVSKTEQNKKLLKDKLSNINGVSLLENDDVYVVEYEYKVKEFVLAKLNFPKGYIAHFPLNHNLKPM